MDKIFNLFRGAGNEIFMLASFDWLTERELSILYDKDSMTGVGRRARFIYKEDKSERPIGTTKTRWNHPTVMQYVNEFKKMEWLDFKPIGYNAPRRSKLGKIHSTDGKKTVFRTNLNAYFDAAKYAGVAFDEKEVQFIKFIYELYRVYSCEIFKTVVYPCLREMDAGRTNALLFLTDYIERIIQTALYGKPPKTELYRKSCGLERYVKKQSSKWMKENVKGIDGKINPDSARAFIKSVDSKVDCVSHYLSGNRFLYEGLSRFQEAAYSEKTKEPLNEEQRNLIGALQDLREG
jgi:hypothetical protein